MCINKMQSVCLTVLVYLDLDLFNVYLLSAMAMNSFIIQWQSNTNNHQYLLLE